MQPLEIKSASISHDYIDCDGHLAPRPFDTIIAKTTDGRRWMLLNGCDDGSHNVVQTYNADRLLPRVKKVGMLKPEFWLGV